MRAGLGVQICLLGKASAKATVLPEAGVRTGSFRQVDRLDEADDGTGTMIL